MSAQESGGGREAARPAIARADMLAAAAGYALLGAAAIETWWRGSPVRWTAVAMVAAYALVSAATWRRTGWRTKTMASALVLAAILAITAWLAGGLVNGVRLPGVSTSVLLSLLAMAGIVLATTAALRQPRLPRAIAAITLLLSAYGLAAFAFGIFAGVPFADLLAGNSFWRPLPYVLRGAVVGALFVLPAGFLIAVVRMGVRRPPDGSPWSAAYRAAAIAAALATVAAAIPREREASRSAASSDSATDRAAAHGATTERLTQLDNSFRAIEEGERESPRDRWDPAYVVERLGRDPQVLFAWVRDNTYWIPYRGTLRGAAGVLMDRQGNALDRAILLATLLEKAGHTVRLANAQLSDEVSTSMLPYLISPLSAAETEDSPDPAAALDAAAAHYRVPTAAVDAIVEQATAIVDAMDRLDTRVAEQTTRLLTAASHHPTTENPAARVAAVAKTLSDHWWVQRQDPSGAWLDMDVVEENGARLATPTEIRATPSLNEIAASQLHHEVSIRLGVEQAGTNGARIERTVFTHVLRPADVLGQAVALQLWPTAWEPERPLKTPEDISAMALRQHEWRAVLSVGSEARASGTFTDRGELAAGAGNPWQMLGKSIGAAIGNTPADQSSGTQLTAAWIDYEIRVPGSEPRSNRRFLFDLRGPERRANGTTAVIDEPAKVRRSFALMSRSEILVQGTRLAPAFIVSLAARNVDAVRQSVRQAVARGGPAVASPERTAMPSASTLFLHLLAAARLEWNRFGDDVYIDRPNVLTRHQSFEGTNTTFGVRDTIDIVANDIGVRLTAAEPFATRLEQGVVDTNVETLLHTASSPAGNTAEAFSRSTDWITLQPSDGARVAALAHSADVKRRLSQEIAAGAVVVVPAAPVAIDGDTFAGWWRIDPATGTTLGIAVNGRGQASGEYSVLLETLKMWAFEEVLCRALPYALLKSKPTFLKLVYAFAPKWYLDTLPPPGDDEQSYEAAKTYCIFAFMAVGVLATLPIVMAMLRYSTLGKLAVRGARGSRAILKSLRRPRAPRLPQRPLPPRPAGASATSSSPAPPGEPAPGEAPVPRGPQPPEPPCEPPAEGFPELGDNMYGYQDTPRPLPDEYWEDLGPRAQQKLASATEKRVAAEQNVQKKLEDYREWSQKHEALKRAGTPQSSPEFQLALKLEEAAGEQLGKAQSALRAAQYFERQTAEVIQNIPGRIKASNALRDAEREYMAAREAFKKVMTTKGFDGPEYDAWQQAAERLRAARRARVSPTGIAPDLGQPPVAGECGTTGPPVRQPTQDLGKTSPDMGDTMPGGRPDPVYAPVRYGPANPAPSTKTLVGLGGVVAGGGR